MSKQDHNSLTQRTYPMFLRMCWKLVHGLERSGTAEFSRLNGSIPHILTKTLMPLGSCLCSTNSCPASSKNTEICALSVFFLILLFCDVTKLSITYSTVYLNSFLGYGMHIFSFIHFSTYNKAKDGERGITV